MNKLVKIIALVASLGAAVAAQAEGKIAVLNVQAAILNTELAQARLKELEKDPGFVDSRKQFEALGKSYQEKAEQLQKDAAVMSAEQKQAEAQKMQEKRGDIEHFQRKLQEAQQRVLQTVMQELEPKLKKTVDELIKSEGIGLLINQQAAMYVDSSYSITAQVTDKLNAMK